MSLQIVLTAAEADAGREVRAALDAWLDRSSDLTIVSSRDPGVARNEALRSSSAPYLHFATARAPVAGTFLTLACRLLDSDPEVVFVTGWGESPLGFAPATRPCHAAMLLGRPGRLEAPTVFRRRACVELGGFDEALGAAHDVDLALRALATGRRGSVVDAPWRPSAWWGAPATSDRALRQKHHGVVVEQAVEILAIKERWLRELAACAAERTGRRHALETELLQLDEEAARLRREQ